MSSWENTYEWIEKYLNNALSSDERSEFENRLKTDREFAETFEVQKASYQIVIGKHLLDLRTQMQKDLRSGKYAPKKFKLWKPLLIVAGVLIVAALLYFVWNQDKKNNPVQHKKTIVLDSITIPSRKKNVDTTSIRDSTQRRNERTFEVMKETGKINPCLDSLISFSCQARGACPEVQNGAIEVDLNTIKKGKAPFEFSIHPDRDFDAAPVINQVKAGKYNLYIKDSNGCIRRLNMKIEVPVVDCN